MNKYIAILTVASLVFSSCVRDGKKSEDEVNFGTDAEYVGKAVGNFTAEEWYPGGLKGTTMNVGRSSYQDETPSTTEAGLSAAFNHGEMFFERNVTEKEPPFSGFGPGAVRKSCLDCHPGYGHGKWQNEYVANDSRSFGNGYLLVCYWARTENSNDGPYIANVTGMPQTMASRPFLPPIDENGIHITWQEVGAMESGLPMEFEDGEKYSLQYPTIKIDRSAFNTDPNPYDQLPYTDANNVTYPYLEFRLESTIGVPGSGLIDAIDDEDIKAQYKAEYDYLAAAGKADAINPAFWNGSDFAPGAFYGNWQSGTVPIWGDESGDMIGDGYDADGAKIKRGTYRNGRLVKKFTYAMTRGSLQDGAGANAIWNITNVSRPDRPFLYTTAAWAKKMSETQSVIDAIYNDETSPYRVDIDKDGTVTKEEIREAVYNLLLPSTNQFDNQWHNFTPEMSADEFYDFMVWHRGLAVPRARNLQKESVQRGKKLFAEMGCASCHRPSWKTKEDNYWSPALNKGKKLPRYQNQTIWPYSDFVQHRLYMKNDIHGSWCRTTPLWGRGLSLKNTGAEDRLHDCRARNTVEAIMWHAYSKQSDAYTSTEKFYNLPKEDRDAVVEFINSI
ncbi:MAG: c-type cytochrome [Bacteroidales bacterium]|nr:c-type cytochrome [Bacteroidales bacterium]